MSAYCKSIACSRGEALKADHIFLWLWDHVPAIEAFDLLMSVALPPERAIERAVDDLGEPIQACPVCHTTTVPCLCESADDDDPNDTGEYDDDDEIDEPAGSGRP